MISSVTHIIGTVGLTVTNQSKYEYWRRNKPCWKHCMEMAKIKRARVITCLQKCLRSSFLNRLIFLNVPWKLGNCGSRCGRITLWLLDLAHRMNPIPYERFKFHQRQQAVGETFDSYLTELRNMRKTCNFCACLSDSLLRDRIVLGVNLKKSIEICKSTENSATDLGAMGAKSDEVFGVYNRGTNPNKQLHKGKFKREINSENTCNL